jgi:hypothetical protein
VVAVNVAVGQGVFVSSSVISTAGEGKPLPAEAGTDEKTSANAMTPQRRGRMRLMERIRLFMPTPECAKK